ncbi:hypothetical protein ACFYT4_26820 [Streptomyces sp. NPDC004609]|uniref:hypothetical protein n=1 Tax=Streptomyces sp. NPDC004609 TaxID=3364704 RepID=UPI0036CE48E7
MLAAEADGYLHAEELAARGHASLTIDRIGDDSSDTLDGLAACIGGQADITHLVVQQLRKGTYRSGDAKLIDIPKAGHCMGMARQAPLVHDTLAEWLDRR